MNELKPGTIFDEKFEIVSVLGSGTFGTVYKAKEIELGRFVAIKVLKLWSESDEQSEILQRFRREAKALSSLSHPAILQVYRFGLEPTPFLVTEFLEGTSLREIVDRSGALSFGELKSVAVQLADALNYAHSQGVVHRDLKPENLIVSHDSSGKPAVKVIDFGLCKPEGGSKTSSQSLTATGALVGTAGYMSPEQVLGQKVDQRTDIYSFACIVFEACTGRPAFRADNIPELLMKQLNEPFPSLLRLSPGSRFPASFDDLLQACASKNPAGRPAGFSEILESLKDLNADSALKFVEEKPGRSRLRKTLVFSVIGFAAIAFFSFVYASFNSAVPPEDYVQSTVAAVKNSLRNKDRVGAEKLATEKCAAKSIAVWPALQKAELYYKLFLAFRDAGARQEAERYLIKFLKTSWPLHNPKTDDPSWAEQVVECHKFMMGEGFSRVAWRELNPILLNIDLVLLKKCIDPRAALLATELEEESNVRSFDAAPDLSWEIYCRHMLGLAGVAGESKCDDLYERFMNKGMKVANSRNYKNHQAYAYAVQADWLFRLNRLQEAKEKIDRCDKILSEIAYSDQQGKLKYSSRIQIYQTEHAIYESLIRDAELAGKAEELKSLKAGLRKSVEEMKQMQESEQEQSDTRHEIFRDTFYK